MGSDNIDTTMIFFFSSLDFHFPVYSDMVWYQYGSFWIVRDNYDRLASVSNERLIDTTKLLFELFFRWNRTFSCSYDITVHVTQPIIWVDLLINFVEAKYLSKNTDEPIRTSSIKSNSTTPGESYSRRRAFRSASAIRSFKSFVIRREVRYSDELSERCFRKISVDSPLCKIILSTKPETQQQVHILEPLLVVFYGIYYQ